jgi:hypothetical protein
VAGGGGFLVKPPLRELDAHELEMLDRVGHIDAPPVDPCGLECLVEQPARRADKGMTLAVLLVARLLAHQDHLGGPRPFAEDGLCRAYPEMAAAAGAGGCAQR